MSQPCPFCRGSHGSLECHRVRVIEFYDDFGPSTPLGRVKRVELHPPAELESDTWPALKMPTVVAARPAEAHRDSPPSDAAPKLYQPLADEIPVGAIRPHAWQQKAERERDEAREQVARLREALRPLAVFGRPCEASGTLNFHDLEEDVCVATNSGLAITAGDCRRAAEVLAETASQHVPEPSIPTVAEPAPLPALSDVVNGHRRPTLLKMAAVLADGPEPSITAIAAKCGLTHLPVSRALKDFGPGTAAAYFQKGPNGWGLTALGGETLLPHLAGDRARTTG